MTLSSRTKSPDFSADGRADILWRNSSTGANNVWLMWSHCIKQVGSIAALGTNWNLIGNGDYDENGGKLLWFMTDPASAVLPTPPLSPPPADGPFGNHFPLQLTM